MLTSDTNGIRAVIARSYPIEAQLELFMDKVVGAAECGPELVQRLRVAKFLCDKTESILVDEFDVRGIETLAALERVKEIRSSIDEILEAIG
jgi:hypothetical protein